ncbi:hypothetical protein EXIGLDRAFT_197127 [Exidia glandulosa HHB12029]|uniref:Uncharacterized protein n=1 Tax=Exidia glandulosa HHB12029 TaxID=1314781 RepID=A0A165ETR8_EXIGL|nr:hypothetical protein EXIGLDRAFT_197127 [Exidia glandulosa HHB12029]
MSLTMDNRLVTECTVPTPIRRSSTKTASSTASIRRMSSGTKLRQTPAFGRCTATSQPSLTSTVLTRGTRRSTFSYFSLVSSPPWRRRSSLKATKPFNPISPNIHRQIPLHRTHIAQRLRCNRPPSCFCVPGPRGFRGVGDCALDQRLVVHQLDALARRRSRRHHNQAVACHLLTVHLAPSHRCGSPGMGAPSFAARTRTHSMARGGLRLGTPVPPARRAVLVPGWTHPVPSPIEPGTVVCDTRLNSCAGRLLWHIRIVAALV